VSIDELKRNLSAFVADAAAGEQILITRHGRPIASLTRADLEHVHIGAEARSLGLAHLRTALWFHAREPLSRFVSLDTAQTQAARELGLPL
jgi:prevent-host-death family protein